MFVASVVTHHAFDDPLILNFIIKEASVYLFVKRCRVCIENSPVALFDESFNVLKNNERLHLAHNIFEDLKVLHESLHEKNILVLSSVYLDCRFIKR